jgi:hypothetical protein
MDPRKLCASRPSARPARVIVADHPSADEPSTIEYTAAPASKPGYDDYRRDELERKVKRSRNALIGTSATALGSVWLSVRVLGGTRIAGS